MSSLSSGDEKPIHQSADGQAAWALSWVARLTPSGALTEALTRATEVSVDWFGIAVLAAWGAVAALAALRWFRFT